MESNDARALESNRSGWSWGKRELGCLEDLERELLAPIEFPLPQLRWNGRLIADSNGLESWMVERGFYGHSLRDAGYVWARGASGRGAAFKGPLKALSRQDVEELWREMSVLSASMEAGELGMASSSPSSGAARRPRV